MNYWGFALHPYSENREHNFSETGYVSFHPQVRGETFTLLGLFERANLNQLTGIG
jgi:hypothetical protein